MSLSRSKSIVIFAIILLGFIIGISLSFIEGIKIYYTGYSLLIGLFIFTILMDLFISLPTISKKSNPSTELSKYMGKSIDGAPPKFIKKIKERAFS